MNAPTHNKSYAGSADNLQVPITFIPNQVMQYCMSIGYGPTLLTCAIKLHRLQVIRQSGKMHSADVPLWDQLARRETRRAEPVGP